MKHDYWATDMLGREADAQFLYNFLVGQLTKRRKAGGTASYVLNVDADWGGGKTYFLEGLARDIEERGHLVARINAWKDDHASDPYVAIMAAIEKQFAPFMETPGPVRKTWDTAKRSGGPIAVRIGGAILKGLAKKHVGVDFEDLTALVEFEGEFNDVAADAAKAASQELEKLFDASLNALIKGFNETDGAMGDFRAKLSAAIGAMSGQKKAPLFILIDELDRCRPTYAVALLERVKHLFDVDGIVFVFATNADQLQHSIAGAYGAQFDGFRYLKRFFDRAYVFQEPTIDQLVERLAADLPVSKLKAPAGALVETLIRGCKAFKFELRAIEHVMAMVDDVANAWPHELPAEITLLFSLCAHFYQTGKAEWPSDENKSLYDWTLVRTGHDQHGRRADRSYIVRNIYQHARSIFNSMEDMANDTRGSSDDPVARYVAEVFSPEWNGRHVDRKKPSIQTELLALVANAGRVTDRSVEIVQ